jgi:hypothetical protein
VKPVRKVNSAGLAGAVATLVLWVVEATAVTVPAPVAAAITTVVAAGIAYFVPSAPGEASAKPPSKPGGPRGSHGTAGRGDHMI